VVAAVFFPKIKKNLFAPQETFFSFSALVVWSCSRTRYPSPALVVQESFDRTGKLQ